jgi:adenosyl cobinamide kinase/adenosyl cobinamide phosphate guanylyltransferase
VIEEPLDLIGAVERARGATIVDCLTLWVSNLLGDDLGDEEIADRAAAAAKACAARPEPTIVISNEVGSGIVPMSPLARQYRDVLGRVNATFADEADVVALMVAGRAMRLSTTLTDLEEP